MYHLMTFRTISGREYDARPVDTSTVAAVLSSMASPRAQDSFIPLELIPQEGSRVTEYRQLHLRISQVESMEAFPGLWVGVRALFLEEHQLWEVVQGSLGVDDKGVASPVVDALVRVTRVDPDTVTFVVVSPSVDTDGDEDPEITLPTETFVEVTTPASTERLLDHSFEMADGDRLGRWPSDEEMAARLS